MENEKLRIERASQSDADEIYALYHSLVGMPYGTWNEEYPSRQLVEEDLQINDVFVMRDGKRIVSAIVNEDTDEFADMASWYPDVKRWAQLCRLGVAADMQGRGIAKRMLVHAMEEKKKDGCEAVRFLVADVNVVAQRAYAALNFEVCGEADAWGDHWLCYEKRL